MNVPSGVDPAGENTYEPQACVRIVADLESMPSKLMEAFSTISKAARPGQVFGEPVAQHLSQARPDCVFFTAQLKDPAIGRLYRTGKWYTNGQDLPSGDQAGRPGWAEGFASEFLDKAWETLTPGVYSSRMELDGGPLCTRFGNLLILPFRFSERDILCLCASNTAARDDLDVWTGREQKLLQYLPELIATALRIDDSFSSLELLIDAARGGEVHGVRRFGGKLFSSRAQLAWKVVLDGRQHTRRMEPPVVSDDYDGPLADYLDAQRFLAVKAPEKRRDGSPFPPAEYLSGFFHSDCRIGKGRIHLYATSALQDGDAGSSRTAPNLILKPPEHSSFVLADTADEARYAVGRALAWLRYKSRMDDHRREDAGTKPEISEHLQQLVGEATEFGQPQLSTSPDKNDRPKWIGWLRYLWVRVFYDARYIQERMPEDGEELLAKLANAYSEAIDQTRARLADLRQQAMGPEDDGSLKVNWRWLYLWFIGNAIGSDKLQTEYGRYKPGVNGFGDHLGHYRDTAVAVLFALQQLRFPGADAPAELWDLPELRPDETMRARIRLLCEYAYLEIGVDRSWKLEHHLGAQFQPEMILQAYSPANREHALHVVDVCLLGHLLMESKVKRGAKPFHKRILGARDLPGFLAEWYAAALLHDVGRAQEIVQSAPTQLDHLGTPDLAAYSKAVGEGIAAATAKYEQAIVKQFEEIGLRFGKAPDGIGRDHGFVSANHLIHSLQQSVGDQSFVKKRETVDVILAIARHSRRQEEFNASQEPLSYLLVLADHLQESSRPRFESQRLAMGFLGATQGSLSFLAKGQHAALYLSLNAKYDSKRNEISLPSGNVRCDLRCAVSESALFEPACAWVITTADLERVVFEADFPVIDLRFIHPTSELLSHSRRGMAEMELLRDFADSAQGNFLFSWLGAISNKKDGLKYEVKDKEECFTIKFGVRRRDSVAYLQSLPKDFYQKFSTWKKRQLRAVDEI